MRTFEEMGRAREQLRADIVQSKRIAERFKESLEHPEPEADKGSAEEVRERMLDRARLYLSAIGDRIYAEGRYDALNWAMGAPWGEEPGLQEEPENAKEY